MQFLLSNRNLSQTSKVSNQKCSSTRVQTSSYIHNKPKKTNKKTYIHDREYEAHCQLDTSTNKQNAALLVIVKLILKFDAPAKFICGNGRMGDAGTPPLVSSPGSVQTMALLPSNFVFFVVCTLFKTSEVTSFSCSLTRLYNLTPLDHVCSLCCLVHLCLVLGLVHLC